MRVLISGAGIAGPTLAYWLPRYGYTPTLVKEAPRLRTGSYIIDFWGLGYDIAEKMGMLPELMQAGYLVEDVKLVNENGKRTRGFSAKVFADITQGRYVSLPRGDLAASTYRAIDGRAETIFVDRIAGILEDKDSHGWLREPVF